MLFGALLLASVIALLLATVAFTGQQILLSTCTLTDLRPLALGENSFLFAADNAVTPLMLRCFFHDLAAEDSVRIPMLAIRRPTARLVSERFEETLGDGRVLER